MSGFAAISSEDLDLCALLNAENLPTQDLSGHHKQYFGFKNSSRQLIAAGGLEICGTDAIVRSCVVAPSHKGQQLGATLIGYLVEIAKTLNIDHLYLLTETAPGFFQKLGFKQIERDNVPLSVAESAQFSQICPQSATAMMLDLSASLEPDLSSPD